MFFGDQRGCSVNRFLVIRVHSHMRLRISSVRDGIHSCSPDARRIDEEDILQFIGHVGYFVVFT